VWSRRGPRGWCHVADRLLRGASNNIAIQNAGQASSLDCLFRAKIAVPSMGSTAKPLLLCPLLLVSCGSWIVRFGNGDVTGFPDADADTDVDTDGDSDADADGETGLPDRYSGTNGLETVGVKLIGETAHDLAGWSVAPAGDMNTDGFDDVLVGAPACRTERGQTGAAYLVLGPISADTDLSEAFARLDGLSTDGVGNSLAEAGDVDGDGFVDLIIGAPDRVAPDEKAGVAYLVYGPITGHMELSSAAVTLSGEHPGDEAGFSVARAGDVDGDGFDDVLVGAPAYEMLGKQPGTAYLVYGPVTSDLALSAADVELSSAVSEAYAGFTVASAGDVDADGFEDVLVSAPYGVENTTEPGIVFLLHGPLVADIPLSEADVRLVGAQNGDEAGWSVSSAGDVDADGFDDVLVGAWAYDEIYANVGAAYVVRGPVQSDLALSDADARFVGEEENGDAGYSVSSAGDVDADGCGDILVGAYMNNGGGILDAGTVHLLYGPDLISLNLANADAVFTGGSANELAGYSVSSAGDVDADGHADLLIGATQDSEGGADAGAAYLVLWARVP
jgi:hypothetical protein